MVVELQGQSGKRFYLTDVSLEQRLQSRIIDLENLILGAHEIFTQPTRNRESQLALARSELIRFCNIGARSIKRVDEIETPFHNLIVEGDTVYAKLYPKISMIGELIGESFINYFRMFGNALQAARVLFNRPKG